MAEGGEISFYIVNGFGAVMDVFTEDGGTSWRAEEMGRTQRYLGTWGDIQEANRVQITTNADADKVFVSWLDTELEDEEDNSKPNIWCRGYDIATECKTLTGDLEYAPTNVTAFSDAMWQAYFGTAPKFCFEDEGGEYTIPFTYIEMTGEDPALPIQIKYIQDFKFTDANFYPCPIGIEDNIFQKRRVSVIGNTPNPFRHETTIQIDLKQDAEISVSVTSIAGMKLLAFDFGKLTQGRHDLELQINGLSPGIYFYTVTAGNERVTKKMVVE